MNDDILQPSLLVGEVKSMCPNELCESVYQGKGSVIRADDGDIYVYPSYNITNATTCDYIGAMCLGDHCTVCKCPSDASTWEEKKGSCKHFQSGTGSLAINDRCRQQTLLLAMNNFSLKGIVL